MSQDVCEICEKVFVVEEVHLCPISALKARTSYLGYADLIGCYGKILCDHSEGSYQGDTGYVLEDRMGRVGFLMCGWGSCSGCDAMQACSSDKDYEELRLSLGFGIKWFDSWDLLLTYLKNKDWDAEFCPGMKQIAVAYQEYLETH